MVPVTCRWRAGHVCCDVLVMGTEPEPVVNQLGILDGDRFLQLHLLLRKGHGLERAVGSVQDDARRRFIDLPALDPDQPVLDVVDPANTVDAAEFVQALHDRNRPQFLAVQADRHPRLVVDLDICGC